MSPGEVVYKGKSKKGKPFFIRYFKLGDESLLTEYINTLSKEETYISFQGEQLTVASEEKYVTSQVKKIQEQKTVDLLAFCGEDLIGVSDVHMQERKSNSHEGVFGISIAKGYRDEGIGSILLDLTISEAEKNLKGLKIITLGVFENNPQAIKMYEKRGFKVSGKIPKGLLHRGEYVDHLFMYKFVREFVSSIS